MSAHAVALAALPAMTPRRLTVLLEAAGTPEAAWRTVCGGAAPAGAAKVLFVDPEPAATWRRAIGPHPESWLAHWDERSRRAGQTVLVRGQDGYPALLADDPLPAPVLFIRGDAGLLAGRRAGIVGTRNATAAGRSTATAMGADLARAGVHVVSGLARGIDGCAHRGALSAQADGRPIAVVGSGLDVPYPPEHAALWEQVAERGLLLSEAPPGQHPEPWRFPQRNRLIAALSEVLVVVESRETGGSLITVDEALERNTVVMAVPGPVASRASLGTNRLIRDGASVALTVDDVLTVLSIEHGPAAAMGPTRSADRVTPPQGVDGEVLDACAGGAVTLEAVVLATGLDLVEAASSVARLCQQGWLVEADGWLEIGGAPP